jgi:ribA/ribD-fused uncharacterized protein
MDERILFYSADDSYGYLSNHYPSPINLKGKVWPTTEHYFQAMKFEGHPWEEAIRCAETSEQSAVMGRSRDAPMRGDWQDIKYGVMKEAVLAKFSQHEDLQVLLLQTANIEIVEHTATDAVWGDGGDGSGQNLLGKLLMEVREEIRGHRRRGS